MLVVLQPYFVFMYLRFRQDNTHYHALKVIYHPLYSMNNLVTNKSKLPQDGAQVFPYISEKVT